jgi:hypothetical protein
MRIALTAGTVLSLAAVAVIASQDPGPVSFPRLPARHPVAPYRALADAPTGNGLELFAMAASICAVCIFVAGWRHARRLGPGRGQQCRP